VAGYVKLLLRYFEGYYDGLGAGRGGLGMFVTYVSRQSLAVLLMWQATCLHGPLVQKLFEALERSASELFGHVVLCHRRASVSAANLGTSPTGRQCGSAARYWLNHTSGQLGAAVAIKRRQWSATNCCFGITTGPVAAV
jgi:hypothetical protein